MKVCVDFEFAGDLEKRKALSKYFLLLVVVLSVGKLFSDIRGLTHL